MKKLKPAVPWILRILISALFLLSGITKMFPVWAFEKQMVDLGIVDWCVAPYLARLIIAFELALGIALLQRYYLKKVVIPATVLLLFAFCVHLFIEMVKHGAMSGSCGCFGQIIPMTPLEAFVKNIIMMGLLMYLWWIIKDAEGGFGKFLYLVLCYTAMAFLMFAVFPHCPCGREIPEVKSTPEDTLSLARVDTIKIVDTIIEKRDTVVHRKPQPVVNVVPAGPKKVMSRFSQYTSFSGETVDLNEGKKILCFFVPGCEECRTVARELCALSGNGDCPEVYVLFMNEETELIPEFFSEAQCPFHYQIIGIPDFWGSFGMDNNTPGVFYLWNGNIIKFWEGPDAHRFNGQELKRICEVAN